MSTIEAKLQEIGLALPDPPAPAANYVPWVRTGNLLFISGQIPRRADGTLIEGKLGESLGIEEGYEAARRCALSLLAAAKAALGDLDAITRVVRLFGAVNATPDFTQHPQVVNGASDLLVELIGERGRHARAAVGMSSLPLGVAVEIEAVFAVR